MGGLRGQNHGPTEDRNHGDETHPSHVVPEARQTRQTPLHSRAGDRMSEPSMEHNPFLPSSPAHKPLSVATSRPESSRVACRLLPCSQCVKQPSVSSRSLVAGRPQRRQTSSRSDATQLNQLGCDLRITLALQSDLPELCAYKGGRPRVGGLSPPWPTPSRVMKSAQRQRRPRCGGAGSGRVV